MLEDRPVVRERLMAFGAFAGIAVFAVAAVDVMVTGGFDFGAERAPYDRERPSAYVRMVEAANYVGGSLRSMRWDSTAEARTPDTTAVEVRLAGEDNGAAPPVGEAEIEGDHLYEEIAALYEQSASFEEPFYEEAPPTDLETREMDYPAPDWDGEPLGGEPAYADKLSSAYENGSPW